MGRQHGERFAEQIARFAEDRLDQCLATATEAGLSLDRQQVLEFCESILPHHRNYAPRAYQELAGIAEAAGLSLPMLMICNGLTDIRDAVCNPQPPRQPGQCTSWMVAPDATSDGYVLAGQTWDMHGSARDYVVAFRRRPIDAPASLTVTTVGCLPLIGINQAGIAIGNNNLQPTDARQGLIYLAIISHALEQTTLAAAVNLITAAPRCSGHNYYLAHADGSLVNIETTAELAEVITPAAAFYAHTNHYLTPALQARQSPDTPSESSLWRLSRIDQLLHQHAGLIDPAVMMQIMRDQAGHGDCNICRTDPADPAPTCAAVVMSPATGRIWATKGPPTTSQPTELELA